jgi:sugar phosphate isomerase/epimerase
MKTEIGISTWLYSSLPLETALEKIGGAGFGAVELWGDTHFHPSRISARYVHSIKRLLAKTRLQVYSLHAPFNGLDIAAEDKKTRKDAVAAVTENIRLVAMLHARVIVLHPGQRLDGGTNSLKELQAYHTRLGESIFALDRTAARYDCQLAVENMIFRRPFHFNWVDRKYQIGWNMKQLHVMIDPYLHTGICLDIGHALISGISLVRAIKDKRVISFHIHDNDGKFDHHLVPGKGKINWRRFFAALRLRNDSPGLIFEIAGGNNPDKVLENIKKMMVSTKFIE